MSTSMIGCHVLAVFAHPDDESLACGGTLARLADAGAEVTLMCASHGERGGALGPVRDDALGRQRSVEIQRAAEVLGIRRLFVWDHPDGELRWAGVPEFHADLVLFMRRHRPDAVITFGNDGLYWHLDHVGVHERTTAAVMSLGADAPPLYYTTMARGVMPAFVHAAQQRGWTAPLKGFWSLVPEGFGIAAEPPTMTLDVGDWVARKMAALGCHRSQMGDAPHPFEFIDEADARRLLGMEYFHRADIPTRGASVLETL
ncbi:MAG: PIG-L deacetylase family protein [Vicinamibacterales bacterium]